MAQKAWTGTIGRLSRMLMDKTEKYINDKLKEESGCGKCGICRNVCKILKPKQNGRGGE